MNMHGRIYPGASGGCIEGLGSVDLMNFHGYLGAAILKIRVGFILSL